MNEIILDGYTFYYEKNKLNGELNLSRPEVHGTHLKSLNKIADVLNCDNYKSSLLVFPHLEVENSISIWTGVSYTKGLDLLRDAVKDGVL